MTVFCHSYSQSFSSCLNSIFILSFQEHQIDNKNNTSLIISLMRIKLFTEVIKTTNTHESQTHTHMDLLRLCNNIKFIDPFREIKDSWVRRRFCWFTRYTINRTKKWAFPATVLFFFCGYLCFF